MRHSTGDRFGFSYRYWTRGPGADGVLHRVHGPALERSDGAKMWFVDGFLARQEEGSLGRLAGWRVFGGYIVPNPDSKEPLKVPREFLPREYR